MWSKLIGWLDSILPVFLKQYGAKILMTAVGITGGFWAWIIGDALEYIWKKEVEPELAKEAGLVDQKKIDDKLNSTYQGDINAKAPESKLIQDETNILNGGRKP